MPKAKARPRKTNILEGFLQKIIARGKSALNKLSGQALKWFQTKAKDSQQTPNKLMKKDRDNLHNTVKIGHMYSFFYDPKHKKTLPYYDRYPLIFPFDWAKGGFYGLNLHYLPPRLRVTLMDALLDTANNENFDDTTKLKISYGLLKGASKYKLFKPCIKHYLTNHVRSKFLWISPNEWFNAIFLPTEKFEKESKQTVWVESRKRIGKN